MNQPENGTFVDMDRARDEADLACAEALRVRDEARRAYTEASYSYAESARICDRADRAYEDAYRGLHEH